MNSIEVLETRTTELSSKIAKLESRIDDNNQNIMTVIGDLAKKISNMTSSIDNMNNRLDKLEEKAGV